MTMHIFTDDSSDDDMLSMSTTFTVSSVNTGSVTSLNTNTPATTTTVAPWNPSWDASSTFSPSRSPIPESSLDTEPTDETGLEKHKEISPENRQDASRSMLIDKHRRTPDPVLGVDQYPRLWNPKITAMIGCVAILLLGLIITGLIIVSKNHQSSESNPTPSASNSNNIFSRGGDPEQPGAGIPLNLTSPPTSAQSLPTSAPSEPPQQWSKTQAPTEQRTRIETLLEILVSESSLQDLTNSSMDQHTAMKWLAEDDQAALNFDDVPLQDIKDRYKAALIFFALSKGGGWRATNGFLSAAPVCEWNDGGQGLALEGIRCESGQVVQLTLDMNSLQGTIPTEIALFDLHSLGLGSNRIGGTIPTELGRLTNLTFLNLGSNNLVGTLPTELSALVSLQTLFLYDNDLEGTIPLSYSSLIHLEYLFIEGTSLVGDVDSALCQGDIFFQSFHASCAADGNITCTCCTSCCDSQGAVCQDNLGS